MSTMDALQSVTPSVGQNPEPMNCFGTYKHAISIKNTLHVKVFIRHRDGLLVTLQPIASGSEPNLLLIEKEYSGTNANVKFNSDGLLNALSGNSTEAKVILDSLAQSRKGYAGTSIARVSYALSYADIKNAGGSAYVKAIDMIVSVCEDANEVPMHPYSDAALNQNRVAANCHTEFDLVDNSGTLGKRFMYFGDSVLELTPRQDLNLSNGLHIRHHGNLKRLDASVLEPYRFIPIDDLEGDHVYASFPTWDAMQTRVREQNKADRLAKAELDKLDREQQLVELKHKLETLKEEYKLSQQKAEDARLALEAARKDYYDHRSYERKDNSELLKYIVLIGGVLLAIWKK